MKTDKKTLLNLLCNYGLLIALLLIIAAASVFSKEFFTVANMLNILRQSTVVGIMAIGVTVVIIAGHIDLSIGSTVSLAGIIAILLINNTGNDWWAMTASVLAGALVGLVNGAIIAGIKGRTCDSFIITFGMQTVVAAVALIYSGGNFLTGRGRGVHSLIGKGYVPILIFLGLAVLLELIMKKTPFGRCVYFMGANPKAAKMSGVSVRRNTALLFVIAGVCASLAAVVMCSRVSAASPTSGKGYELDAIAAVVVGGTSMQGGKGGILRTLLGVVVIGVLGNALNILNITTYPQMFIRGVIIIAAVLLDVLGSKLSSGVVSK